MGLLALLAPSSKGFPAKSKRLGTGCELGVKHGFHQVGAEPKQLKPITGTQSNCQTYQNSIQVVEWEHWCCSRQVQKAWNCQLGVKHSFNRTNAEQKQWQSIAGARTNGQITIIVYTLINGTIGSVGAKSERL